MDLDLAALTFEAALLDCTLQFHSEELDIIFFRHFYDIAKTLQALIYYHHSFALSLGDLSLGAHAACEKIHTSLLKVPPDVYCLF